MTERAGDDAEARRLHEDATREKNWKRWGSYLAERQWGTIREDYSEHGTCWDYFPHDHARSRVYRWGEDGLLGLTDRQGRLCFAPVLWNGRDPILKERFFGLNADEGNHGEDVKECYFYLDATPTHSYMKALYKYPQAAFPYTQLVQENRQRGRQAPEFELIDTGVFDTQAYFDVLVEYAKAAPNDILIHLTITNRGIASAPLHLLPTLWFRNTWSWGRNGEGYWPKPRLSQLDNTVMLAEHTSLGRFRFAVDPLPDGTVPPCLFTENETHAERMFGCASATPYVKDAWHAYVLHGQHHAVNPAAQGTKAAWYYRVEVPAGSECRLRLRLYAEAEAPPVVFGTAFDDVLAARRQEADQFYANRIPATLSRHEQQVARQAYAGLLWSKQFFHYVVKDWLEGDPQHPTPPASRLRGRNHDWQHLYNREVISMPDKWEYPWYAAWDLAFHMLPFARIDIEFAKEQLVLLLREWYMHPNGQLPAYEFAFADVSPPVHAWACWQVYQMTGAHGARDRHFLARTFQKLLINFTWWVNRKDIAGKHLFSGGFLGLDNIGVFDRGQPLPGGGQLAQADGTAWMAFYCTTMLAIALELAREDAAYEDAASKFFEHFIAIADAMNTLGGTGLWDEEDGFYYDQVITEGRHIPLRVRSLVGLTPLFAVEVLEEEVLSRLPGFQERLDWFLRNRPDLSRHIAYMESSPQHNDVRRLLAIPSRQRLEQMLRYLLDEREFLAPHGIRSLSRMHAAQPYIFRAGPEEHRVDYAPGESTTSSFGPNSNWRGPIWLPMNYLLIEALERYHSFYGDSLRVECPTGSGQWMNLQEVAQELAARLTRLFLPDAQGHRPCHGGDHRFAQDPHWRELVLFHEYFHGEHGRGLGASHQTGWTALITRCLERLAAGR